MSLLRDNDFTAKAVKDMIAEVEGRKPRKKKAPPQPTIVYNTVYNSEAASSATISIGNSSAQRQSRRHRHLGSLRLLVDGASVVVSILQTERMRSTTGKCSDDGRGLVKNLSGRLARTLQRSCIAGQCWSLRKIQTVLDAATVDRCDFVESCCSDAPSLREAMQQHGISSFSLLRSDGVGNHDAQTREKLLGLVF